MQTNATYSGISAKIRAMSANLISSHMYEEITTLSSVPEFTAYLCEKTTYGSYLKKADARLLHRGEIETFLSRGVYEDFKKLYRFADNNQRKYLDLYFKSFEIEMLKKCIRHIYNSKDKENDILYYNNGEWVSKDKAEEFDWYNAENTARELIHDGVRVTIENK